MVMTVKMAVPKPRTVETLPEGIDPGIGLILESYPHIGNKIIQTWGSIELQRYLTKLIIDERGDRQGFPPPIASALLRIYDDHSKLVPEDNRGDPWHSVIL